MDNRFNTRDVFAQVSQPGGYMDDGQMGEGFEVAYATETKPSKDGRIELSSTSDQMGGYMHDFIPGQMG